MWIGLETSVHRIYHDALLQLGLRDLKLGEIILHLVDLVAEIQNGGLKLVE